MKPAEIAYWKKTRAQGKLRFILQRGVLAWGMPMFIITTFVVNKRYSPISLLAVSFIIWALSGAAFGWLMWTFTDRKYRKATEEGST